MSLKNYLVSLGLLILFGTGCGGSGGVSVTAQLLNATDASSSSSLLAQTESRINLAINENLTLQSLQIPICSVGLGTGSSLSGDSNSAETIYVCSGTTASECYVELIGDSLENLFDGEVGVNVFEIPAGTYTFVTIETCGNGGDTYPVLVQASGTLDSTTYYTTADGSLSTTEADAGLLELSFQGARNYSINSVPITIAEGDTSAEVNLFIDLTNISAFTDEEDIGYAYCSEGSEKICMSYPDVAGAINVATPTIEHYVVSGITSNAAKLMALFVDPSSGETFGGFFRPYFSTDDGFTQASSSPGTFKKAETNEDASLLITDYGSNTDSISGNGNFVVSDFSRLDLNESATGLTYTNSEGTEATFNVERT